MANTDYGRLRDGLWDIQKEFGAEHSCRVSMHHDLFWSPEFEGWDEAEYRAFIEANTMAEEFTGEEWDLWPGPDLAVEVLQTDLQIGAMSAGAPLANLRGELIGIFVAKKDDVAGLSFAVPSKYVRELLESGARDEAIVLERGFLGIQLDDDGDAVDPPLISQVFENSPAAKAGFKKGDSIVKVDGEATSTSTRVVRAIGRHKAGDKITITSKRDGVTRELVVTLGAFPKSNSRPEPTKEAIQLWHPGHIVIVGLDGQLKVWTPDAAVKEFPLKLKYPTTSQADLKLSQDRYKALIEKHYRVFDAQGQFGRLGQPAIRVERSDVEKQLAELTERVMSLQTAVQKLTEELRDVGTKLKDRK